MVHLTVFPMAYQFKQRTADSAKRICHGSPRSPANLGNPAAVHRTLIIPIFLKIEERLIDDIEKVPIVCHLVEGVEGETYTKNNLCQQWTYFPFTDFVSFAFLFL
mgnify:CR=1 FL=1